MRRDKSADSAVVGSETKLSKRMRTSATNHHHHHYGASSSSAGINNNPRVPQQPDGTLMMEPSPSSKLTTRDLHRIINNKAKTNGAGDGYESSSSGDFVDLRKYFDRDHRRNRSLPPKTRGRSRSLLEEPGSSSVEVDPGPVSIPEGESRFQQQSSLITYRRQTSKAPAMFTTERQIQTTTRDHHDHNYASSSVPGGSMSVYEEASECNGYETDTTTTRPPHYRSNAKAKQRLFRSGSFRSITKMIKKKLMPGGSGHSSSYDVKQYHDSYHHETQSLKGSSRPPSRPNSITLETCSVLEQPLHQAVDSRSMNGYQSDVDSHVSAPVLFSQGNPGPSTRPRRPISTMVLSDLGTPGLCGIRNHGNTCYINSVVQCLSNTDQLAEYFVTDRYTQDLLSSTSTRSHKQLSNGEITHAFVKMIRALWFDQYTKATSENFKTTIERHSEQYCGGQQQDCQEFCLWLLDKIHQDINLATKRKYKPLKHQHGKPESQIAQETLDSHLMRDRSIITDLFQAQFRSCVRCPDCRVPGLAFDPYMCVSLPVPQRNQKPLFVILVFLNRSPRLLCLGLNSDVSATFGEVVDCLGKEAQIAQHQMVICELTANGFYRTFRRGQLVTSLGQSDTVYCFETPPIYSARSAIGPSSQQPQDDIVLLVMNRNGFGSTERLTRMSSEGKKTFGGPLAVSANREFSYSALCRAIFSAMSSQFKPEISAQNIIPADFRLCLKDTFVSHSYLPSNVDMPLYTESVDSVLQGQTPEFGPPHLKIIVEWEPSAKQRYFAVPEEYIVDHVSACDLRKEISAPRLLTLEECLRLYTQPERIDWNCHSCKGSQKRAERAITFWSLPEVLVVHLKRFNYMQSGEQIKVDALVEFPVTNLDLTPFLCSISDYDLNGQSQQPIKNRHRINGSSTQTLVTNVNRNIYDLYAVCNHHGESIHSGHYTAYCKNPIDLQWYCFDDDRVTKVDASKLATSAAYLLFYERRASSRRAYQMGSSMESGFGEHWSSRLVVSQNKVSSQDTLDGIDTDDEAFISSSGGSSNGYGVRGGQRSPLKATPSPTVASIGTLGSDGPCRPCSVVLEPIPSHLLHHSMPKTTSSSNFSQQQDLIAKSASNSSKKLGMTNTSSSVDDSQLKDLINFDVSLPAPDIAKVNVTAENRKIATSESSGGLLKPLPPRNGTRSATASAELTERNAKPIQSTQNHSTLAGKKPTGLRGGSDSITNSSDMQPRVIVEKMSTRQAGAIISDILAGWSPGRSTHQGHKSGGGVITVNKSNTQGQEQHHQQTVPKAPERKKYGPKKTTSEPSTTTNDKSRSPVKLDKPVLGTQKSKMVATINGSYHDLQQQQQAVAKIKTQSLMETDL